LETPDVAELSTPQQLLVSRKDAARLLGTSTDVIKKLERLGKLRGRRLTGDQGSVYFLFKQITELAEKGCFEGRGRPKSRARRRSVHAK
jgi:hypothetical protein